ncbi:MAG TPA: hypothetical protein VFB38_01065 [Chthonomonadaceae bacterium]|nr:hypothetical protein [Chthonomonadaceae bacterium]
MAQSVTSIAPPSLGKMTYEEFLDWPGENQHVEWVNGEVVPMRPVTKQHQDVRRFLVVHPGRTLA